MAHTGAATDGHPVELPALPDGAGLFVVVNPGAGQTVDQPEPGEYLRAHLPAARVHELGDGDDLAQLVEDRFGGDDPPRVLGVAGGDGSVSAVAHAARMHDVPLLLVPGGTFNHFARTVGVPDVVHAVRALQRGEGVAVDVAELTFEDDPPVTVTNAASIGLYPALIDERDRFAKRLGKRLGLVVAAWRVLDDAQPLDVEIAGRRRRVWSVVASVDPNDSSLAAPLQRARLSGGVLDVRVLDVGSRWRALAGLAFGRRSRAVLRAVRLLPRRDEVEAWTAEELTVIVRPGPDQPTGFAHDGEIADPPADDDVPDGGDTSRVRIVPRGLRVYRTAG